MALDAQKIDAEIAEVMPLITAGVNLMAGSKGNALLMFL
jgi:hypothetical protein